MQIENALILAAGFGTRMGEIGKTLPKIMWPIYNKSLLELQVCYLKELGVKRIFINLHYQKENILSMCHTNSIFDDVIFLEEKEILGVGGAIHNLARRKEVDYKGRLLIVNADQFSFFEDTYWKRACELSDQYDCALFTNYVDQKFKYNETLLNEDGFLVNILPKGEQTSQNHLTYSGFGFINLGRLNRVNGESNFFQSVANYTKNPIPMVSLPLDFEYWDFGTKERYLDQMLKLKNDLTTDDEQESAFVSFLKRNDCVLSKNFYFEDKIKEVKVLFLDETHHDIARNVSRGNYIAYDSQIERVLK